jgi:hypothetical protein
VGPVAPQRQHHPPADQGGDDQRPQGPPVRLAQRGRGERGAFQQLVEQAEADGDVEAEVDRVPGLVPEPAPDVAGRGGPDRDDEGTGADSEQRGRDTGQADKSLQSRRIAEFGISQDDE